MYTCIYIYVLELYINASIISLRVTSSFFFMTMAAVTRCILFKDIEGKHSPGFRYRELYAYL